MSGFLLDFFIKFCMIFELTYFHIFSKIKNAPNSSTEHLNVAARYDEEMNASGSGATENVSTL